MYSTEGLDEIDQIIVEGLSDYVDVSNAALKEERGQGKFILGGRLKQTPEKVDRFEEGLSLGMSFLNERAQDNLAADIPDSPINREIHGRLVQHFMGRTNHGLRSALATMGLESPEKKAFRQKDVKVAVRAADRAMELISGRQRTAGYPLTGGQQIVGGHQVGRNTSKRNNHLEQILYNGNMEVEGALEGQVRHEHRGAVAADRLKNRLIKYLIEGGEDSIQEDLKIIDAVATVNNSKSGYRSDESRAVAMDTAMRNSRANARARGKSYLRKK